MSRKADPNVDALIAKHHRAHRTEADIVRLLAKAGIKRSLAGVHFALARQGLAPPRKGAKVVAPAAPVAVDPSVKAPRARRAPQKASAAPSAPDKPAPAETVDTLRAALESLQRAAGLAEAEKDVARVVSSQNAIAKLAVVIEKFAPQPPALVDERPDMIAAAKRAREKMHELLDRMLKGRAA